MILTFSYYSTARVIVATVPDVSRYVDGDELMKPFGSYVPISFDRSYSENPALPKAWEKHTSYRLSKLYSYVCAFQAPKGKTTSVYSNFCFQFRSNVFL